MSRYINSFFGDSLWRTFIKLAIVSFVVGVILSAINVSPYEVWEVLHDFFISLYNLGFDAIWKIGGYLVWGAMVVVPVFIIIRLLKFNR